jgi:transposase-like protein
MSRRTRRNHRPAFKAKIALAAIKGEKTLADLAQLHDVHPTQIAPWKARLVEGAAGLFGAGSSGKQSEPEVDLKTLHAKIGELTLENVERFWLGGAAHKRRRERVKVGAAPVSQKRVGLKRPQRRSMGIVMEAPGSIGEGGRKFGELASEF